MSATHLCAAWLLVVTGILVGVALGLFFHREGWLGGYASWQRRMLRLGHIAFFGTAFLNLLAAMTPTPPGAATLPGWLLVAGGIAMPTVCFLSAWRKPFHNAFFIPVLCLLIGSAWIGGRLMLGG